ncbi:HNH endonuclease [Micromonospora sediminicola]|uniref:HNH endonuclease n=1 Tax=Micromonospora sediminicola TaxID=946078 RepID=UPI003792A70F
MKLATTCENRWSRRAANARDLTDCQRDEGARMGKVIPITDRFMGKVKQADGGCWLWTKQVTKSGYARFSAYGKSVSAHRFAYEHFVGPIPAGMTIEHICHTADPTCRGGTGCLHRRCVRPQHLVPLSGPENVSRAYPARKTHCVQGHEFTAVNTHIRVEGGYEKRTCRTCRYQRKNSARSAARAHARTNKPPKPRPSHCRRGHPYAGENLYVVPSTGVWQCRACNRASEERRKQRRQVVPSQAV